VTPPHPKRRGVLAALFLGLALAFSVTARARSPEPPSGWTTKHTVSARHQMVATANPFATDAGQAILDRGGSAVDAAIAVQMVLNLVEPQSSGIGGGAFMLVHDAGRRTLLAYDGRETAPAAARPPRAWPAGWPPMPSAGSPIPGQRRGRSP